MICTTKQQCQEASEIIIKHQEGLGNTRPGRATSLGLESRLFRESRLGRDTRLGRETRLSFEGRLYRDRDISWVSYTQIDKFIISIQLPSPLTTFMMLPDFSWCLLRLLNQSWLPLTIFFICFCKRLPQLVLYSVV